ncbi:hypothetical protein Tco_1534758, partial [Tanacetum coccineum]
MLSNSDDIHFDTRPPMLDRTNYESWSQQIQLYCRGKENGLLILQSIDQGPFELRTTRNTLGTTPEGDVRATNIMLQGLPKDIYKLINHNIKAKAIWDNVKLLLAGSELTKEDRESQLYDEFKRFKMLPGRQNQRYFAQGNGAAGNGGAQNRAGNANAGQGKPDKMLLMQAQENGAVLDEEELLFLADECDAFDSDVDDEPTTQSIFMANLSSAGLANPQAGPSNASILFE